MIERKVQGMATAIQEKYHWNDDRQLWIRIDRVQEYRGHEIATVSYHRDWLLTVPDNHRGYLVTYPSGRQTLWTIDKRGGNIKNLKEYIDFNVDNNRTEYL